MKDGGPALLKLGPQGALVLLYLAKKYRHPDCCDHFFFREIAKGTKLNNVQAKRATRKLAHRGLVELRPLFFEDNGLLAGSGYGCTPTGLEIADAMIAESAKESTQ